MVTVAQGDVVWQPQEGPQTEFLKRVEFEALYGGAAGGGKTDALLVGGLRYVHEPECRAVIFRRTYPELEDIILRSQEIFSKLREPPTWNEQKKWWIFPSGAVYRFRYMEAEKDKYRYQGQEFQYIGFDELTHFTESQYLYLFSRCRSRNKRIPARIRTATNPGNKGHAWVKRRFVTIGPPRVRRAFQYGHQMLDRVFIPAKIYDNKILLDADPSYLARLEALPPTDRAMLLDGDWDVFAGMAFPEFDREVHIVPDHPVPNGAPRYFMLDWGYGKPSACGWFYRDQYDTLVMYRELYTVKLTMTGEPVPNEGVRWTAFRLGQELAMRSQGERFEFATGDPSIFDNMVGKGSVGDDIAAGGFPLLNARMLDRFKGINDRLQGKVQVHRRLSVDRNGRPGIKFMESCQHTVRTITELPLNENRLDDVDTDAEDHCYDMVRQACRMLPMLNYVEVDVTPTRLYGGRHERSIQRKSLGMI